MSRPWQFLEDLLNGLEDVYPECDLYQTIRAKPAKIDEFFSVYMPSFMYNDNTDIKSETCINEFEQFFFFK